jgi:hypothetical protein
MYGTLVLTSLCRVDSLDSTNLRPPRPTDERSPVPAVSGPYSPLSLSQDPLSGLLTLSRECSFFLRRMYNTVVENGIHRRRHQ